MTNEEAIKVITTLLYNQTGVMGNNQREGVFMAVDALGKQIAKKPIHDSFYYHCPICNGIVYKGRGCANNECRQKIDWSEDNE